MSRTFNVTAKTCGGLCRAWRPKPENAHTEKRDKKQRKTLLTQRGDVSHLLVQMECWHSEPCSPLAASRHQTRG
jgi:hypothetical protein